MVDARTLRNLQILALDSVENPDPDAYFRKICRWYSEKFHTPLLQVLDSDPLHILQTYYEERFGEAYKPDEPEAMRLYNDIKYAICFPEEVAEAEEDDEAWEEEMRRELEQQNVAATLKAQEIVADQPTPAPPNTHQGKLDSGEEIVVSGEDDLPPTFEE